MLIQALPSWGRGGQLSVCGERRPTVFAVAFCSADAPPRAPRRVLHPTSPSAPPTPPAPSDPLPRRLPESSPVLSTAFFGRESCRFAASPKVGVYPAERYKYGRLTVFITRSRQRSARAPLTGEMSPPFLLLRGAPLGPMSGRGWQPGRERRIAGSHRVSVGRFGWSQGIQGREVAEAPSPGSRAGDPIAGVSVQAGTQEALCSLAPTVIL